MKKSIMLIAAMCMTSVMTFAQKVIRVSTDKTDLVMKVSPKGRLAWTNCSAIVCIRWSCLPAWT